MSLRALCTLIACLSASILLADSGKTQPNILILYADDLGYGDLGCQNLDSKIPTPHLDKFAKEGMIFTDGHSSSGICTPSRYAMLTGRHHWRKFHGIVSSFGGSVFSPDRLTIPEMLRTKGYETAVIGKWHLGWDWASVRKPDAKPDKDKRGRKVWGPEDFDWSRSIPDGPLAHGFDYYFGDTVINFPPYCWIVNDRVPRAPDVMMDTEKWKPIKEGNWECRPGPMISDWDPYQNIPETTKRAVDYINVQRETEKPFFLYFAFPSPHAPIIPNDQFDGRSEAGAYGDFVVETDDACGRILKALEESGQADNTIVIFTADNGPERYAYARDKKFGHWSSKPFRGLKRDVYEGGHHVPFLIRWPGVTKAGSKCEALVSQIDLMATFAAVLGITLPDGQAEDSFNLLPLLQGKRKSVRASHIHNTYKGKWAIRNENWILVDSKNGYTSKVDPSWEKRHQYPEDDAQKVELYDLASDPRQRNNLAAEKPQLVKKLKSLMSEIRKGRYPDLR